MPKITVKRLNRRAPTDKQTLPNVLSPRLRVDNEVVVHTDASTRDVPRPTDTRSTCCRPSSTPGSSAAGRARCHAADESPRSRTGRLSAVSTQQHQQLTTTAWLTSAGTRRSVRPSLDVLMTSWQSNPCSVLEKTRAFLSYRQHIW